MNDPRCAKLLLDKIESLKLFKSVKRRGGLWAETADSLIKRLCGSEEDEVEKPQVQNKVEVENLKWGTEGPFGASACP